MECTKLPFTCIGGKSPDRNEPAAKVRTSTRSRDADSVTGDPDSAKSNDGQAETGEVMTNGDDKLVNLFLYIS